MANAGIIHLALTDGGRPLCGTRRSHMSTTIDRIHEWPRVCVKCQAIINRSAAKKAQTAKQPRYA